MIAKYLDGREAEIFSVPFDPTSPMARPAEPRSLGRLAGFTEPATGSDLHGDLSHLAICSSAVTRIYGREDVGKPGWKLLSEVRYPVVQIEGICWDGRDLVLVAEGGAIFRNRGEDLASRDGAKVEHAGERPTCTSGPTA